MTDPRPRPARIGVLLVRGGISALLLGAVFRWLVPPADWWQTARHANPLWLLAAAALLPAGLGLQWYKWRVLLRAALPQLDGAAATRSLLAGFGLGLWTPGRLGEVGRGVLLPGHRRLATWLSGADKAVSWAVTVAMGAVAGALVLPGAAGTVALVGLCALGPGLGLAVGVPAVRRRLRLWTTPLTAVPAAAWGRNLGAAVLFNLIFWAQLACLLRASGPVSAAVVGAVPAVFALKALLPVSFMDIGVREGAGLLLLVPLGVPAAAVVHATLTLFVLNVLLPGVAGTLQLAWSRHTDSPTPRHGVEFAHVR